MKIVAVIQARMGSTRLPGKVLIDLGGESVLGRVVRRLRRASRIHEIMIATTDNIQDEAIVRECDRLRVAYCRGSEHDVLDRYLRTAEKFRCDLIVRVTSDCPLIDAELVDEVIQTCMNHQADFACNDLPPTFPRGLDVEVLTIETLRRAEKISYQDYQREHVTPVIYERPDLFRIASVRGDRDLSHYRWTLDTPEDLQLVRAIYAHFENRDDFSWQAAVELIEGHPELAAINAHIAQRPVGQIANVS
jgi:spore coat polysaccharide biosynthesis protein SpsF